MKLGDRPGVRTGVGGLVISGWVKHARRSGFKSGMRVERPDRYGSGPFVALRPAIRCMSMLVGCGATPGFFGFSQAVEAAAVLGVFFFHAPVRDSWSCLCLCLSLCST